MHSLSGGGVGKALGVGGRAIKLQPAFGSNKLLRQTEQMFTQKKEAIGERVNKVLFEIRIRIKIK